MSGKSQCCDFESRIHDLLDQRLSLLDDQDLAQHASDCLGCQQLMTDYQVVINSFDQRLCRRDESIAGDDIHSAPATVFKVKSLWPRQRPMVSASLASLAALLLIVVGFNIIGLKSYPQPARMAVITPPADSTSLEAGPPPLSNVNNQQFVIDEIVPKMAGPLEEANRMLSFPVSFGSTSTIDEMVSMQIQRRDDAQRLLHGKYLWHDMLPNYHPNISEMVEFPSNWVSHTSAPATHTWRRLSQQIEPLNPYWQYTSDLPGIRPFQNSFQLTIELIQQSLNRQVEENPDAIAS